MSEMTNMEVLTQLLRRIPGAVWSSRVSLQKQTLEWIYVDRRTAELHDMPEAEVRADAGVTTQRVLPEDRARVDALLMESLQTLAPIVWTGRVALRSGGLRWIESHIAFERESEETILMFGQVFDVTERKQLEQALADSEEARRRSDLLHRTVIDAMPVGVAVVNQAYELQMVNPAQQQRLGFSKDEAQDVTLVHTIFKPDGVTPITKENGGLLRALRGEVLEEELLVRNPRLEAPTRLHILWTPLRDERGEVYAALSVSMDITTLRALEQDLRTRNAELAASEEAKTELIDRLRYSIAELESPILEIWDDVLLMPIIGMIDSRRTADMVQRLLTEVARTQSRFVIIDLTGVEIVDTRTADHLMKMMRKVEVVGARCVLTGIRAAVAETLVDIGVDFARVTTLRNLKHGLREALRSERREPAGARRYLEPEGPESDDERPRGRAR